MAFKLNNIQNVTEDLRVLEIIPFKNITRQQLESARGGNYKFLCSSAKLSFQPYSERKITNDTIIYTLEHPYQLLQYPPDAFTGEVVSELIRKNCNNISYIPREKIMDEHLKLIATCAPKHIGLFRDRVTSELLLSAELKKSNVFFFIKYCPPQLLTVELCRKCAELDIDCFNYFPYEIRKALIEELILETSKEDLLKQMEEMVDKWKKIQSII